jgi:hypothetical protein
MTAIERIHFFSWTTSLSVELPVGFEEETEDDSNHVAIYIDMRDDDDPDARVMTRMTAVPQGESAAYRGVAAASAALDGRNKLAYEECTLDGAPAVVQVLAYHDDDLEIDIERVEMHAQIDNVIFSVIGITPQSLSALYRSAFDHACRTARIVLPDGVAHARGVRADGLVHVTSESLELSMLIPDTWVATEPDTHTVRLGGPHSTMSIVLGEPEGAIADGLAPDEFTAFCDDSVERLRRTVPDYELYHRDAFELSSLVRVHVVWFASRWEDEQPQVQMQALGYHDRYHLYVVNAASPASQKDAVVEQCTAIVRSLRILPKR